MITKELLLSKLSDMDLKCYETASDVSELAAIQMISLEQLLEFIVKHKIDTVFYHYDFVSAELLQITDEVIADLDIDDEIARILQGDFEEYNREIEKLDFSRPYNLVVYCIYQNYILCFCEQDIWFVKNGFGDPKKAAMAMIKNKLAVLDKKMEDSETRRMELREQLREKILADESFHRCTNKDLRKAYTSRLWKDKSIQELFYTPMHGLFDIPIHVFIEEIWREYKDSM